MQMNWHFFCRLAGQCNNLQEAGCLHQALHLWGWALRWYLVPVQNHSIWRNHGPSIRETRFRQNCHCKWVELIQYALSIRCLWLSLSLSLIILYLPQTKDKINEFLDFRWKHSPIQLRCWKWSPGHRVQIHQRSKWRPMAHCPRGEEQEGGLAASG